MDIDVDEPEYDSDADTSVEVEPDDDFVLSEEACDPDTDEDNYTE